MCVCTWKVIAAREKLNICSENKNRRKNDRAAGVFGCIFFHLFRGGKVCFSFGRHGDGWEMLLSVPWAPGLLCAGFSTGKRSRSVERRGFGPLSRFFLLLGIEKQSPVAGNKKRRTQEVGSIEKINKIESDKYSNWGREQ